MTGAGRVGIVVTDHYAPGDEDNDTGPLTLALEARGVEVRRVVWHRSSVGRGDVDLLVLRSPWDYPGRVQEFRDWLREAGDRVPVLNPPALVEWNLDKTYLREIEVRGVPIVPTTWVESSASLASALSAHGDDWVVIKPTVSAGAVDTGLVRAGSSEASDLGGRILGRGLSVMVQPEIPELSEGGEKALYYVDGAYTHAIAKGALLARGGGFAGGVYQEHPRSIPATDDEIAFGASVLQAVVAATGAAMPLYARIDLVASAAHGIVLLEAELFEPALNLHVVPEVADVLAEAILRRLG